MGEGEESQLSSPPQSPSVVLVCKKESEPLAPVSGRFQAFLPVRRAGFWHTDIDTCLGTFGLSKSQLKVPTPRGQAPCPPCLHTLQGTARHGDQRTQHVFLLPKVNGRAGSVKFRRYAEFHLESMKHLSNAP